MQVLDGENGYLLQKNYKFCRRSIRVSVKQEESLLLKSSVKRAELENVSEDTCTDSSDCWLEIKELTIQKSETAAVNEHKSFPSPPPQYQDPSQLHVISSLQTDNDNDFINVPKGVLPQ